MLQEAVPARPQAVEAWAAAQLLCTAMLRRRWQVGNVRWKLPSPASLECLAQAHGDNSVCVEQGLIMHAPASFRPGPSAVHCDAVLRLSSRAGLMRMK